MWVLGLCGLTPRFTSEITHPAYAAMLEVGRATAISSNRREEQELGTLCLHILQSAFGLINTLMIQDTLALPEWENVLTDADRRGASAILWAWSTCPECRDRRWTG